MIEEAIAKLTAAVSENAAMLAENNTLLRQILESSGSAPAAEPQPEAVKPAKAKKEKASDLKVVEPEPEAHADEPEEDSAVEAPKHTVKDAIEASKEFLGKDRDTNKPKLAALREKFGVETVKDLAEDQVDAYLAELAKL
jgi:hypothetical protein